MINPFFEGIAAKPERIVYFVDSDGARARANDLTWTDWGARAAVASGIDGERKPIEVVLSRRKRCGPRGTLFYTRITVAAKTHPLQCQVDLISGQYIGDIGEDVTHFDAIRPLDYYFYVPAGRNNSVSFYQSVWRNLGRPVTTARGVTDKWWGDPHDFRWVSAGMTQSRIGYCAQFGTLVYLRVKLTAYGPGMVIQAGDRVQRHSKALRSQAGKARPRHTASYDFSRWCKRRTYPEEYWRSWH